MCEEGYFKCQQTNAAALLCHRWSRNWAAPLRCGSWYWQGSGYGEIQTHRVSGGDEGDRGAWSLLCRLGEGKLDAWWDGPSWPVCCAFAYRQRGGTKGLSDPPLRKLRPHNEFSLSCFWSLPFLWDRFFELAWNFIPDFSGSRTLKILKSFTNQVFTEMLPHLTGPVPSWPVSLLHGVTGFRKKDSGVRNEHFCWGSTGNIHTL